MLSEILFPPCPSCPFNDGYNEEASVAQNYGCLPTKWDILKYKDDHNRNWMCHSDPSRECNGLARERDLSEGLPLLYEKWYHEGDIPITREDGRDKD